MYSSLTSLYEFNFLNTTHPLPPPISPTTSALTSLALLLCFLGVALSSLLLFCIAKDKKARDQRHGGTIQASFDVFFFVSLIMTVTPNMVFGSVPSNTHCQLNGFMIHFTATAQFSSITGLCYERLYRLRMLRDETSAGSDAVAQAPHWQLFKRYILPLLFLHAAMPIMTNSAYGVYTPKPNSAACYASGGKGVRGHDMFPLVNDLYFFSCFVVVLYSSFHSLGIVHALLATSSGRTAATRAAAKAERRAVRFSVAITLLFIACWSPVAVYFAALPFGYGHDWPPL